MKFSYGLFEEDIKRQAKTNIVVLQSVFCLAWFCFFKNYELGCELRPDSETLPSKK